MKKNFFDGRKFYWIEGNQIWSCDYEKVVGKFGEGFFKKPGSEVLVGSFQTIQEAEENFEKMKKEIRGEK